MKKFFKIVAVIALLGGVSLGCTKDYTKEIEGLQKTDTALQEKITAVESALNSKIDGVSSTVASLKTALDATNAAVEALKKSDAKNAEDIKALQAAASELEGRIADLEKLLENYKELEAKVAELDGRVETLEGDVDTINGEIDDINGDIDDINAEIVLINTAIDDLQDQIDALDLKLDNEIARIDDAIIALDSAIDALEIRVADLEADMAQAQDDIIALQDAVEANKKAIDLINEALVKVKSDIAALQGQVSALAARIQDIIPVAPTTNEVFPVKIGTVDTTIITMGFDIFPEACAQGITVDNTELIVSEGERGTRAAAGYQPTTAFKPFKVVKQGNRVYVSAHVYNRKLDNTKYWVSLKAYGEDEAGVVAKASAPVAAFEKDDARWDFQENLAWFEFDEQVTREPSHWYVPDSMSVYGMDLYDATSTLQWPMLYLAGSTSTTAFNGANIRVKLQNDKYYTLPEAEQVLGLPEGTFAVAIDTREESHSVDVYAVDDYKNVYLVDLEDWEKDVISYKPVAGDAWGLKYAMPSDKRDELTAAYLTGLTKRERVELTIAGQGVGSMQAAARISKKTYDIVEPFAKNDIKFAWGLEQPSLVVQQKNNLKLAVDESALAGLVTTSEGRGCEVYEAPYTGKATDKLVDGKAYFWTTALDRGIFYVDGVKFQRTEKEYDAVILKKDYNDWGIVYQEQGAKVNFKVAPFHADVTKTFDLGTVKPYIKDGFRQETNPLVWAATIENAAEWTIFPEKKAADLYGYIQNLGQKTADKATVNGEAANKALFGFNPENSKLWTLPNASTFGAEYVTEFNYAIDSVKFNYIVKYNTVANPFDIHTTPYVVDGKVQVRGSSEVGASGVFSTFYNYQLEDIHFDKYFRVGNPAAAEEFSEDLAVTIKVEKEDISLFNGGAQGSISQQNCTSVPVSAIAGTDEGELLTDPMLRWYEFGFSDPYKGRELFATAYLEVSGQVLDSAKVNLWTVDPIKASSSDFTIKMIPGEDALVCVLDNLKVTGVYDNFTAPLWIKRTGIPSAVTRYRWASWNIADQGKNTPWYGQGEGYFHYYPTINWKAMTWKVNGQGYVPVEGHDYYLVADPSAWLQPADNFYTIRIVEDNLVGNAVITIPVEIPHYFDYNSPATCDVVINVTR